MKSGGFLVVVLSSGDNMYLLNDGILSPYFLIMTGGQRFDVPYIW